MNKRNWIRENRAEIDAEVAERINGTPGGKHFRLNDAERAEWINNDEGLYLWARSEGVRL